jgi:predicted dehydrogenase
MSETVRFGIVGSGFAGRFQYESLMRVNGVPVEVEGVYSRTEKNRDAFASERNIKSFATYEAMLENVDAVVICTPGYTHETFAVKAANAGVHVVLEKPFTGYYGPDPIPDGWKGNEHPKEEMLREALDSAKRIRDAVQENGITFLYAENWVYAPAVQKEVEIIQKTGAQILWAIGEESHSGSHSSAYGVWNEAGGGSMVGKGCHPMTAVLYLKRVEGEACNGTPIRPRSVTARTHEITRNPSYRDKGHLRTDYYDVEDFSMLHIVFEDGMVADIYSSEIVMGGVHNWIEIYANNHRNRLNLNPIDACTLYNPDDDQLKDVYIVEKISTKAGWNHPAPDEDWQHGYPQEIQNFAESLFFDREPYCGVGLGCDTVSVLYSAYLSAERMGQEVEIELI